MQDIRFTWTAVQRKMSQTTSIACQRKHNHKGNWIVPKLNEKSINAAAHGSQRVYDNFKE